jgi:4-hydroxy-3-polyprenylbenzoate decarboxylase
VRIFVGITGASGAPYASRLIEALSRADHEILLCASRAGIQVLATELYGDAHLSPDETLARLVEPVRDAVTIYDERDWRSPAASGSARIDGYVVCPCSMGTLGAIASGTMTNLIQRAASVALKEGRTLVLMPRETPLSTIHLEGMLTVRRAGASVLFLAPGFYHGWERVDQLLDFVVGRCLDQLGVENTFVPEWGAAQPPVRDSGPGEGVWGNREVPPAK